MAELRKLKCCVERNLECDSTRRRLAVSRNPEVIEFLKKKDNVSFLTKKRSQDFGKIARSTFNINNPTGGAYWYSVDRSGNVRMHYWYTMGYGRAWGKS